MHLFVLTLQFKCSYPALYNIVRYKDETIAKVLASSPPNVTFRRTLLGPRLALWNSLLQRLSTIQLFDGPDVFRWNLLESGKFSVGSMYKALIQPSIPVDNNKKIWKMKIPLKTKIFAWYLRRGVILTKDNLVKRNWHGCTKCVFCHHDETIKHLFFQCSFARTIWSLIQMASGIYPPTSVANIFGNWLFGIDVKYRILIRVGALAVIWSLWLCRNDKVFNNKASSFLQVIYRSTALLRLWTPLQRLEFRDLFAEVCTRLEDTARDIFSRHGWQRDLRICSATV